MSTAFHQAALAYVAEGYRIIPCRPGTKLPRMEDWLSRALETQEQVNAWFTDHPDDNLAFCPEDMGMALIDIDPGADCSQLVLPQTRMVRSPRGGHHRHYLGSCRATVSTLAEHIDTRGQKSYALLPPSVTEHGSYVWEDDRPAVALPFEIEARLAARNVEAGALTEERDGIANINRGRDRLSALVRGGIVAVSGSGGNNLTYKILSELIRDLGLLPSTAVELIEEHWNPHCIPPWERTDLLTIASNVERYGQNEEGAHAVSSEPFQALAPEDQPEITSYAENALKGPNSHMEQSRFRFMSAAEMMNQPDPVWIVPDLIPEGALVLLTAAKGSFKSFLALDIALGIATGSSCLGISHVLQGCTFYGAHEGFSLLAKMHRVAWCQYHGFDPSQDIGFYMSEGPRLAMVDDITNFGQAIKRTAQNRCVRLIVIDTYSASMTGCDENNPSDANRFIFHCRQLLKLFPQAAILVPAHFGKDDARGTRGSNALEAGFDVLLTCHRGEDKTDQNCSRSNNSNHVSVNVVRQRGAPEREKPIDLKGQPVAGSLVFLPIDRAALKAAKLAGNPLHPSNVAATLMLHGYTSSERTATTSILAALISPQYDEEAPARYAARLKETERTLARLAQSSLKALAFDTGRDRKWCYEAWPSSSGSSSANS